MVQKLRWLRISKGMTQKQLAETSQVPRICIARYETGEHAPSIRNASRLANALGCRIEDLIGGNGDAVSND